MKKAEKIQLAKAPEDDLRAEVVVADLIESGQHPDTVTVHLLGAFKRKFSRDIERIETSDEWQNRQEQLLLFLNRNGLYDHLPQGLMHQPMPGKKTTKDAIQEIRYNRKKEAGARRFFHPWEQEFFRQRVFLELEERRATDTYQSEVFHRYWDFPRWLQGKHIGLLVLILPIAYRLAGQPEFVCEILRYFLDVPVRWEEVAPMPMPLPENPQPILGEALLGLDTLLGGCYTDTLPRIVLKAGPVLPSQIASFLPGGSHHRLTAYLCNFLIPFDREWELLPWSEEHCLFAIPESGKDSEAVLGFSTQI